MNKDLVKKELLNNFNEFINNQSIDPYEVCVFIYSFLKENNFKYRGTGCNGEDWELKT